MSYALTEAERLAVLNSYHVLGTREGGYFVNIIAGLVRELAVPMAAISLIAADTVWFKARMGMPYRQIERTGSFSEFAARGPSLLCVGDASQDQRFADNPMVTGDPFIRGYLGAPLITQDNVWLGTICALDTKPRLFSRRQVTLIRSLAATTMAHLELHRVKQEVSDEPVLHHLIAHLKVAEERGDRDLGESKVELIYAASDEMLSGDL
jgi:GAF domain-containing protein